MSGARPRYWVVPIYLAALLLAIPWYWPAEWNPVWRGFPLWVLAALLDTLLVALFTAWLLLNPKQDPADNGE